MSLFKWKATPESSRPQIGDRRTVRKLVICKLLGDEWRAFGFERIVQERRRWKSIGVDRGPITVVGWRDAAWADREAP